MRKVKNYFTEKNKYIIYYLGEDYFLICFDKKIPKHGHTSNAVAARTYFKPGRIKRSDLQKLLRGKKFNGDIAYIEHDLGEKYCLTYSRLLRRNKKIYNTYKKSSRFPNFHKKTFFLVSGRN